MTSKEALEKLVSKTCIKPGLVKEHIITYSKEIEHNEKVMKLYELIKQDLDRLETLISILQKFIDEEEYFVLHDNYLSLGIDGSINITQQQCDVLKSVLNFKE